MSNQDTYSTLPTPPPELSPLPIGTHTGDLSASDLERLGPSSAPRKKSTMTLRDSHHHIARLMAQGLRTFEIAALTNFSAGRISQLRSDPAMLGLIEEYRLDVDLANSAAIQAVAERVGLLAGDTMREVHKRLDENPSAMRDANLLKLLTITLDRSGHGPTTKHDVRTIHVTKQDLEDLRERMQEEGTIAIRQGDIVEGVIIETSQKSTPSPDPSGHSQASVGEGTTGATVPQNGEAPAPRSESKGTGVRKNSGENSAKRGTGPDLAPVDELSGPLRTGLGTDRPPSPRSGSDTSDRVQTDTDPPGLLADEGAVCAASEEDPRAPHNDPPDLQEPANEAVGQGKDAPAALGIP